MASRHPRLGVTRDTEVERALALTEPLLDPTETRSAAAQIRALTLRGAQSVLASASPESQLRTRLAERYGATPGRGSLLELDPPPEEPDPADATPASDALQWVRGE
jgi:phosphoserine phosphatase